MRGASTSKCRGFTLIELLIAVAIFALLALLAVPMYGQMIANSEIRNAAENILTGVRSAQAEAIRSNQPVKFVMGTSGWDIYVTDNESNDFATSSWRSYHFSDGASRASMSPSGGEITFNGLGQIIKNVDTTDTLDQVDVTSSSGISGTRALRVLVGTKLRASAMKMCDPSYSDTDPMGCPSL